MRYGLPTLFHIVELAFVQQSKKHTYQFTGSQRECSFMLMGSYFSKFLVIKSFELRAVPDDASGGLYHVIPQIAVSGFVHRCVLCFKVPGLVFLPDNAAIPGKCKLHITYAFLYLTYASNHSKALSQVIN